MSFTVVGVYTPPASNNMFYENFKNIFKEIDKNKELILLGDFNLNWAENVCRTVRASLMNFRHVRHQLPLSAAKLHMHSMISSHLSYCVTSRSQAGATTLKPLHTLYKLSLKTLDEKPRTHHCCDIVEKYNLLTFDSFLCDAEMCLMYNLIHDQAPPPLKQCVLLCRSKLRETRASARGERSATLRKTAFGQSAFSLRAAGNGTQFLPTLETVQASVFLRENLNYGSRKNSHVITGLTF